jgi:protein Jumonji
MCQYDFIFLILLSFCRTKIHAQRKFAQGAATPVFSPSTTPIKEKEKVKPTVFRELITHRRPNTEDFLTFLCFRGKYFVSF